MVQIIVILFYRTRHRRKIDSDVANCVGKELFLFSWPPDLIDVSPNISKAYGHVAVYINFLITGTN